MPEEKGSLLDEAPRLLISIDEENSRQVVAYGASYAVVLE
jgi:hypothetical protein